MPADPRPHRGSLRAWLVVALVATVASAAFALLRLPSPVLFGSLVGGMAHALVAREELDMPPWAFRLGQDPNRLAKRYLVRGPRIFQLLRKLQFELRPAPVLRKSSAGASLITAAVGETEIPEST